MITGDAAESVVKFSLEGFEVAVKIVGSSSKNILALLLAFAKEQRKVKGKTKITNLLKSGKELKVFTIKQEDLKKFTEGDKRYGVLFSSIIDKKSKNSDGMVDIMVRAEDASKINRIVDRFKMATVNIESIKKEIDKSDNKENISKEENLVSDILFQKEEKKSSNPTLAMTEKSPLSKPSLENRKTSSQDSKKPSVREEIQKIKREQLEKDKTQKFQQNHKTVYKQPINKHHKKNLWKGR